MFLLACYLILTVAGLFMMIHAAFTAPMGDEDDRGFYVASSAESAGRAQVRPAAVTPTDLAFFHA